MYHRSDLEELLRFDSGPSSLGSDNWVVYSLRSHKRTLLVHCEGVAAGWEFDGWERMTLDRVNARKLKQLLAETDNSERCRIVISMKREGGVEFASEGA